MESTPIAGYTTPGKPAPHRHSFARGLARAIGGYVLGGLVFVFFALTTPADPGDRVAGALDLAWLLDVVPTILFTILGVLWLRSGRRRSGLGVLVGVAVGLTLTVAVSAMILWEIRDWSGTCPCDPPVRLW